MQIWFRHYQILDSEDGSLAEIGPRFVMEPIKIFDSSFSGRTLWENPNYISPAAQRSMLRKAKAGKYIRHVESKAAYEANKPTEPTYKVDATEDVFKTIPEPTSDDDAGVKNGGDAGAKKKKNKNKRKKSVPVEAV